MAPDDYRTYFALGFAAQKAGRRREAVVAYKKALELNPRSETSLNNLAAIQMGQWRLVAASRSLASAAAVNPTWATVRRNIDALASRALFAFHWLVFVAHLSLAVVIETAVARSSAFVGVSGGALVLLFAAAVLLGRSLPESLRSHYHGLLRRDRWLAVRLCTLVTALALFLCSGVFVNTLAYDGLFWLGWACLCANSVVTVVDARRRKSESRLPLVLDH